MRIISLNTWGARVPVPYFNFIRKHASDTDVFCLQEVWSSRKNLSKQLISGQTVNQLQQTAALLADFVPVYCSFETNVNNYDGSDPKDSAFGVAIFVKTRHELLAASECFVFLARNSMVGQDARTLGRNVQHVQLGVNGKILNLFNFHGLWNGNGKTDTPQRLEQSKRVVEFLSKFASPKILIGDFNLLPDTESLGILKSGMRDLIEENSITNTRSSYYTKDVKFADYALVTPDVKVSKFTVMPDEVSDHLPLMLDIEL